jgi:hypothetical protein
MDTTHCAVDGWVDAIPAPARAAPPLRAVKHEGGTVMPSWAVGVEHLSATMAIQWA